MDDKSVVTLRIPKKVAVAAMILIMAVAAIAATWLVYPLLQKRALQSMTLTLVARNGTTVILKESDISRLQSFESRGGFKTSVGRLGERVKTPLQMERCVVRTL